jgi:precorrin-3B C17-methyltransferase
MSDFATISLSDLMIPWETIERRLAAVSAADMVVALYNPSSSQRRHRFQRSCEVLLQHRPPCTPVGVVRNAGRPGQQVIITELGRLPDEPVDMLTVILVGNSATIRVGDRLVTRRHYQLGRSQGSGR